MAMFQSLYTENHPREMQYLILYLGLKEKQTFTLSCHLLYLPAYFLAGEHDYM